MRKHTDFVFDHEGNAVVGVEVYVRKQADNSLASLYSDDGVTAAANPCVTDNDGKFSFYAANNTYKLQVYVDAVQQNEINQFQHFDLDDISTFVWTIFDDVDALAVRNTIGLGTIATQAASAVAITGGAVTGITDITVADGGTGASTASAARTNLGLGTIATFDETTAAQYRSNTSGKALSTDKVWAAADYVALTDAATVAMDMSAGFNFSVTLGGNRTLAAPTNTKNGQTGTIVITQDGTGSRTLAYHANWKFAEGTDPTLSTAAASIDILFYQVLSSTSIYGTLVKALA